MESFSVYLAEAARREYGALERALGYRFNDPKLLKQALTHRGSDKDFNYERLEFLGDKVLAIHLADKLYHDQSGPEGKLADYYNQLARQESAARVARALSLEKYIIAPKDVIGSVATLGDVVEAILGAIYLDSNKNTRKTATIAHKLWAPEFERAERQRVAPDVNDREIDWKSKLQDFVQKNRGQFSYSLVSETGLHHQKVFEMRVDVYWTQRPQGLVKSHYWATGKGSKKARAEQEAARQLYQYWFMRLHNPATKYVRRAP